jgi:hypothetical protein
MWQASVEIGRIMTEAHGPGILRGQLELLLQAMPVVVSSDADFWGVGLTPLFLRWNFSGTEVVRPFVELAAGFMLIDWETPGPYRYLRNFNEQIGLGLRIGAGSRGSFVVGGRFQHISRGSTEPSPSLDTYSIYAGYSSLRAR